MPRVDIQGYRLVITRHVKQALGARSRVFLVMASTVEKRGLHNRQPKYRDTDVLRYLLRCDSAAVIVATCRPSCNSNHVNQLVRKIYTECAKKIAHGFYYNNFVCSQ